MDADLQNALQDQYLTERQNAEEYLCRANILDNVNWPGSSHFMLKSSGEEREHAQRIADYLIARNIYPQHLGTKPVIISPDLPLEEYFMEVYDLEVATTEKINNLYRLSVDADDPQTTQMLLWYLDEQTKSVKETYDMVQELHRATNDAALLILDEKYAEL